MLLKKNQNATLIQVNQCNTDKQNLEKKIGDVDKKIPDRSGLATATIFNTTISEVESKLPDNSTYITTTLAADDFATRIKQVDLVNKTNFDNKETSFNGRITSNKTKHLEFQKKLDSLIIDYNFFLGRIYFTNNDRSQNTFFYQPILDISELKKDKGTDYVLSWKSKGVFNSKLKPLYTAFLNSVKLSEYRIGIKFDKDPLTVEQNNYLTKIVNVCIVYDLDARPRYLTNNLKFKNFLFGATNIVKNSDN